MIIETGLALALLIGMVVILTVGFLGYERMAKKINPEGTLGFIIVLSLFLCVIQLFWISFIFKDLQ